MFGQWPKEALDTITEEEIQHRKMEYFEDTFTAYQSIISQRRWKAAGREMRQAIRDRGYD